MIAKTTFPLLVAAALALPAAPAQAQDALRHNDPRNQVQLSASASLDVPQDWLTVNLTTTRDGADAQAIQAQLRQALDTALNEAKKAAAPGQLEVRTGNFSLAPRYGRDGKISAWVGTTELVLEGRDFARISATAGKLNTLTLGNIAFSLSREARAKVEGETQAQAIERFKAKARDIAKSFEFNGYTLGQVSISANDQPPIIRPRMMAMKADISAASEPIPVEAGKATVTTTVSGSVLLQK